MYDKRTEFRSVTAYACRGQECSAIKITKLVEIGNFSAFTRGLSPTSLVERDLLASSFMPNEIPLLFNVPDSIKGVQVCKAWLMKHNA